MNRLRSLGLSTRLTLLGFATLCPIAALTVFAYFRQQELRAADARKDALVYSETVASGLDHFAQDLEALTLAASLAIGQRETPPSPATDERYLRSLVERTPVIRFLFVTNLDGTVLVTDSGNNLGLDLSQRPYIQALKGGAESYWSGGLEGVQSGQQTVAFTRVIRRPDGTAEGYLGAAFYPGALSEILGVPANGHIVVVDQNARLLFSSRSATDPEGGLAVGDRSDAPVVVAAVAGRPAGFRSASVPFDSGERFGYFVPLPTMGWALGFTRSQSDVDAALRSDFLRDLAILGLISLLSIGLLLLVARATTRPLRALSGAARQMQLNEFAALPEMSHDPDVDRLRVAFVEMQDAVRRREEVLAEQARILMTLEHAGALLAADLDHAKTVQGVTDAGVQVTEAAFGAFFYNVVGDTGESYQLFALAGVGAEVLANGEMPRNTELFAPTFRGDGPIRIADVREDERYGKMGPHFGMPSGHPPVCSYLAVPVVGRLGEVIGGLFFGHPEPGRFSERHETLAVGIASWASIALDNARLYQDSLRKQAELEVANRAKDEFLDLVSHELRTPITVIHGATEYLMARQAGRSEGEQQLLTDCRDGVLRLANVVQNILVLAHRQKFDASEFEPILLRPVLAGVRRELHARSPRRTVTLELPTPSPMVHGSRVYLEQAFGNLLSNADKYSPPDAPIEVTVVATEGGELQIAVRDHGPGLSDTDRDRIFEPYYRGEEARRRATGFGLGLAVSKQLVEAMGGRLWLDSPGEGACFIIALPSEPDATDKPSRGERSRSEPVDGAEAGQRGMDLMPA